MRSPLFWNVFRSFWARRDVALARRHLSCGNLPLEELFARGGPLRTFLERQVGSEAQLQVRRPQLVAAAKLLSDKEQELQETQHLLHGKGLALGSGVQSRGLTLRLPFAPSRRSRLHTLWFWSLYSVAALYGLHQRSRHHYVSSGPVLSLCSLDSAVRPFTKLKLTLIGCVFNSRRWAHRRQGPVPVKESRAVFLSVVERPPAKVTGEMRAK